MSKTVADRFADVLATAGLPRIWSIVGDSRDVLSDAIRTRGRIEWIHGDPSASQ
jgi:pyruvate dehydrogenase (quinone)